MGERKGEGQRTGLSAIHLEVEDDIELNRESRKDRRPGSSGARTSQQEMSAGPGSLW